jgi:hypothetical protein
MRRVRWLRRIVVALIVLGLGIALAIYPPEYVYRVLCGRSLTSSTGRSSPSIPYRRRPHPTPSPSTPARA